MVTTKLKVEDLITKCNLTVFSGKAGTDKLVSGGYVSDLLSDVMGNAKEGQIWVTLQTHKNITAIASLKDLAAIVLVKGLAPDADTQAQSEAEGIPILGTQEESFDICGKLYNLINGL